MSTAAWLVIFAACGAGLPDPPVTSRAVESGWGDPFDGLSILVATDSREVPLGAEIRAEVFFRYSPFLSGTPGSSLLRDECTESWRLLLRDVETGRVWTRDPYHPGMPHAHLMRDPVPLSYETAESAAPLFILLADDGEQVPAGTYDVTVRYRNDGSPGERQVLDPAALQGADPDPTLWRGTVDTAPMRVRVLPRDADTTRCDLPTAAVFSWDEHWGALAWDWDSWESVELISRPGYHVAMKTEYAYFVGDEPFPTSEYGTSDEARREHAEVWGINVSSGTSGLPRRDGRGGGLRQGHVGGKRFREVLDRGEPIRMVIHAKVFESSVPSGHWWMPESGAYRVLREWDIVGEWP